MQRDSRGSKGVRRLLGCLAVLASACPGLDLGGGDPNASPPGPAGSAAGAEDGAAGTLGGSSPLEAEVPDVQSRVVDDSPAVATNARWRQAGMVTTLHGKVLDAATGMPVEGEIYTAAACTGCMRSQDQTQYWTPITNGEFAFKGTLTLFPETAFTVYAKDHREVEIAHGPKVSLQGETTNRSETELPTLYVCAQDANDEDHDGICDDAEKRYGTKPSERDSDGDGLSDTLELYGHPYSGEDIYYDIYSLGADPMHRDIFIAIRYTKTSELNTAAFPLVQKAFEKAPAVKDGKPGIHLHILYDDQPITGKDDIADLNPAWTAFEQLRPTYFGDRPLAFHHALWANKYDSKTSSGVSRGWGAADLLVTLGEFKSHGTALEQAGTLMHELGHNLGLHHNGYTDEAYAPHYMSIMSYAYQMYGIERSGADAALDFAGIELAPFNEADIDEKAPFKPAGATTKDVLKTYLNPRVAGHWEKVGSVDVPRVKGNLGGELDLNCDGKITEHVKFDLNRESSKDPEFFDRYPATRNDWASLAYGGGPKGPIGDMYAVSGSNRVIGKDFEDMPPCLRPHQGIASPMSNAPPAAPWCPSTPASNPSTPASNPSTPAPTSNPNSSTPSNTNKPATPPSKPPADSNKPSKDPSKPPADSNKPSKDPSNPGKQSSGNTGDKTPEDGNPSDASVPETDASVPETDASVPETDASVPDAGPGGETTDAAVAEPEAKDAAAAEPEAMDAAVAEPDAAARDAAGEEPWIEPGATPPAQPEMPTEEPSPEPPDGTGEPTEPTPPETDPNAPAPEEPVDAGPPPEEPVEGIW